MKTRLLVMVLTVPALLLVLGAPAWAQQTQEELDRQVDSICRKVEEIRGLKFKRKVRVGVKTRKELRRFLLDSFKKELPPSKAKKVERTYKKMGLLPKNCDLRKTLLDLLTSQIGGFYNPETKRLYVVKAGDGGTTNQMMKQVDTFLRMAGTSMAELVAAHELTHALQDQHYSLMRLQGPIAKNDDRVAALKCLFEGDAVYVQNEFMFSKLPPAMRSMIKALSKRQKGGMGALSQPGSGMENVPEFLRVSLGYPYIGGPPLIERLKKTGEGKALLRHLYKNPPMSTEQIMHLDKLLVEKDEPQRVLFSRLKELLPEGAKSMEGNVLGEMGTYIMLKGFLGRKAASKAAAGWDGDSFQAFDVDGQTAFVWVTTWDSVAEAREFAAAYQKVLDLKYKRKGSFDVGTDSKSGLLFVGCGREDSYNLIVRKGADVFVIEGLRASLAHRAGRRIWDHVRKEAYKHHTAMAMPGPGGGPFLPPPSKKKMRGGPFALSSPGLPWKQVDPTGRLVKLALQNFRTDARIEAAKLSLGEVKTPGAVGELLLGSARRRLSSFVPGTTVKAHVRGLSGVVVEYTGRLSGQDEAMRFRHAIFCRGAKAYVLTVSAPVGAYRAAERDFWNVLAGLEIKE